MQRIVKWWVLLCLAAAPAFAQWTSVVEGVDYRRYREEAMDIHVARIDLTNGALRVVATRESERGLRVSEFAKKTKAIVAINADYFTKELRPVGLAVGPCGRWEGTKDTERAGIVAAGTDRARIDPPREVLDEPEPWMKAVVSGWPLLVKDCDALTASELPGSDAFTRAPHPRTAVGLSDDGRTMYFVVADGRREGVPGLTLARLAQFMRDELDACAAMNLDGGGSSAMWVGDAIVNRPSDGNERSVADHLAVIRASDEAPCD
jgi:exopolysaccharide biosynthesis protein